MPQSRRSRLRVTLLLLAGLVLFLGVTAYSLGSTDQTSSTTLLSAEDEQLRDDTVALGVLSDQDADCLLKGFRDAGFTAEETGALARGETPDGIDPSAYAEANAALRACLDDDALRKFTAKSIELSPPASIRNSFITSMMAVSAVAMTREQGGCVYDSLVASGIDFADVLIDPEDAELGSHLDDALLMCGLI
ncbi:hypothetical protein GCM10027020_25570 [Nocardioides salsibiostraticola]